MQRRIVGIKKGGDGFFGQENDEYIFEEYEENEPMNGSYQVRRQQERRNQQQKQRRNQEETQRRQQEQRQRQMRLVQSELEVLKRSRDAIHSRIETLEASYHTIESTSYLLQLESDTLKTQTYKNNNQKNISKIKIAQINYDLKQREKQLLSLKKQIDDLLKKEGEVDSELLAKELELQEQQQGGGLRRKTRKGTTRHRRRRSHTLRR